MGIKQHNRADTIVFVVIALLFAVYASVFIYRTSFVIEGERYFSLFDDGMVSMRYAKNLATGQGLVMNPHERIEGFTNPLWVFYMAFWHLFPVPQSKISLLIQVTGALLLVANLFVVMNLARTIFPGSRAIGAGSMLLTAFYLPLNNWSLQGMEVSLVTLIFSIATLEVVRCLQEKTFSRRLYLLLGLGTLVRIDMAAPYLGVLLFLLAVLPHHRKRNLGWGLVLLAFFLGAQTLSRFLYYGEVLPNTYYLKMTGYPVGLRIARGFLVFLDFAGGLTGILFLVPMIFLLVRRDVSSFFLAWIFGVQCVYSIYVGGDAWESWGGSNRYLSVAMPVFFVLLSRSFNEVVMAVAGWGKTLHRIGARTHSLFVRYGFSALILLSLVQFNNNQGPLRLAGLLQLIPPPDFENNVKMVTSALFVRDITTPDARVAVIWAGALPYFSERYTVDMLGKTDKVISRLAMRQSAGGQGFRFFYPGHLKYDYRHSIGILKPDIITQFWGDIREAEPFVVPAYTKLVAGDGYYYIRNNSPRIRWDRLPSK